MGEAAEGSRTYCGQEGNQPLGSRFEGRAKWGCEGFLECASARGLIVGLRLADWYTILP